MLDTQPTTISLEDAILTRRSVRGFLDTPVPQEVLEKVFTLAQRAPSNCNIQPWRVFVASGATRDRIREQILHNFDNAVTPNPDFDYPSKFQGEYRRRQIECAVALYSNIGVERDDIEGRKRAARRNFELFDAPHVAFIGMYKDFGATVAVDVGMYAQTLMLAMTAYGIASCAQGSMRYYPDIVRAEFPEAKDARILFGISFGYENPDLPANKTVTARDELPACVTFRND